MKSPFPGMDPYLEDSEVWRGFHHGLAEGIRIQREALVEELHKLRSVQVKRTDTHQLVTTIEILSPFNKRGEGIYQYQDKRCYIRKSNIWPVSLNEALPVCPVPLLPPDPDVALDLNEVLAGVYARGVYGRRLDYSRPVPPPALRPAMQAWLANFPLQ